MITTINRENYQDVCKAGIGQKTAKNLLGGCDHVIYLDHNAEGELAG